MANKKIQVEDLEKVYQNINLYGTRSKYWDKVDEIIEWLASLEEYEKCAELVEIKEGMAGS